MLKGNLSTRPFYNERLVLLSFVLIGIIGAWLTYFNYQEIQTSSSARAGYQKQIDANDQQANRISGEANTIRQKIDQAALKRLANDTREANLLIDQRTFSWTVLFGILERTLPIDVRLLSISPKIEKGNTQLTLSGVAKRHDDIQTFVNALYDANGMFYSVSAATTQRNDDGTFNFLIDAYYLAPKALPKRGKGQP